MARPARPKIASWRHSGRWSAYLAPRTCPSRPDVAIHREHTGHVVQLLGHVLADALHLAAALAHGGFGLMADLAPREVGWQRRTLGNLLLFNLGGRLRFL